MQLHELTPGYARQSKNRVGRGIAAGQGKTAGRGTKGQKSRSGHNIPRKFEGGQSSLWLRMPKARGFQRHVAPTQIVDRALINSHYTDGETVSPTTLVDKGLVKRSDQPIKLLGKTPVTVKVTFEDIAESKQPAQK